MSLLLPPLEVHVWYLLPQEISGTSLLAGYEELLTDKERARRDRYVFEPSRREYLLTRVLVKTVLSRYAPIAPKDWRFRANEYGRPEIDLPEHRSLRFNLSNTRGLIACAVARDREIGIDVEDPDRAGETLGIANHFFSAAEVRDLNALPVEQRRARFFDYWTLKEAYIKARGMGMSLPLAQFSFVFEAGARIRIVVDPALGDDASSWQFEQLNLSSKHHAAAAVRCGTGPDSRFILRRTVPLVT